MPMYEYRCENCKVEGQKQKPIEERFNEFCPRCGQQMSLVPCVVNNTFGWTLSDKSHKRFVKDEWVRAI